MGSGVRRNGAVCLLAVSLVTGCGSSVSGKGASSSIPAPSTPAAASSSASATPAELGSALEQIALHAGDLATGFKLQLMPGGDKVDGQVTLDNCGFDFTTETHRVARRQYNVLASSADTGLSNELVAYDTPAQAAEAVTQWHTSAATCPHTPVHSTVSGEPDLLMKITQNKLDVATLPAATNALTVESGTAAGQGTLYNVSILQVHGRYLDAMYLTIDRPITTQELNATVQLATITGQRLTAQN
jgi:hypothetical protein